MNETQVAQPHLSLPKKELKFGMKWSFFGHLLLIGVVLIKSWVFPGQPLRYVPTLKVDLVGLPDALKNEANRSRSTKLNQEISKILKQAEKSANRIKTAAPIKDIAQKDEMVVHPNPVKTSKAVESKNKRALDRLKALAKIQEVSDQENDAPHSAPLIKGNALSPGSSLSGDAREASESNYLEILRDRVQEYWALPTWVARQNLSAQVRVFVDARGKLRAFHFTKVSGNSQFDEAVKKAIQESQPFPFPPKDLVNALLTDGISLGFPL